MEVVIWLMLTGAAAGIIGAMVGVGGGFIAVPIMTLFIGLPPQLIIGTSLTMTFFTALSSTLFLWKQKRIDVKTGWKFALATFPGAVIGSHLASFFSARGFNIAFGCLMLMISLLMWKRREPDDILVGFKEIPQKKGRGTVQRVIIDAWGLVYRYQFNIYLGIVFSFLVGFISSVMGIGGGIIHVPLLVMAMKFPPHIAAATSLFILAWSSLVGAATHFYLGHIYLPYAAALALGGLLGAQLGVRIASRLQGGEMVKIFSVVMAVVGIRLILS